jgi:membrane-bound metal-dependent hydrolase YbcI (DUF457 family)
VPFTPFHLGPGLALAGLGRWVDFWAFAAANVLIDLESGWNLWRGAFPVHRFFHTFAGAALVIAPAAALAVAFTWFGARLAGTRRSSVGSAAVGAALGAMSHVVLDSIMHGDMRPLAPWSDENPLLGTLSLGALHNGCLLAGAVGVALFGVRVLRRRTDR